MKVTINNLPNNVYYNIVLFLDPIDIINLRQVNSIMLKNESAKKKLLVNCLLKNVYINNKNGYKLCYNYINSGTKLVDFVKYNINDLKIKNYFIISNGQDYTKIDKQNDFMYNIHFKQSTCICNECITQKYKLVINRNKLLKGMITTQFLYSILAKYLLLKNIEVVLYNGGDVIFTESISNTKCLQYMHLIKNYKNKIKTCNEFIITLSGKISSSFSNKDLDILNVEYTFI